MSQMPSARTYLLALLMIGLLIRIAFWAIYEPIRYPDTGTYLNAAKDLLEAGVVHDQGRRTPGYPMVFALFGQNGHLIWMLQSLAGLGISLLLFYLGCNLTRSPTFAFLAGLSYDLNVAQVFFEASLLSESLTTLCVTGVVALFSYTVKRRESGRPVTALLLALGVLAAYVIMLRPQFVFLVALLPLALMVGAARGRKMRAVTLAAGAVVAAPMVLIVGGWVLWIQAHFGYLSMSTQTGFALANHSVGFIEFAPERYAPIRDIMLKYRAARLAAGKHPSNTIFDALPELQRTMGMTLPEVGREVQLMSTQTFQQQPLRYAGSVGMAWASFWAVDNYWVPQKISPRWLVRPLEALWWVEHKLLRASNLVFVLLGAASLIFTTARRRLRWGVDLTVASLVVILSSLVQALAEYGGNPRYGVTVQPLVVLIVMTLLWQLRTRPKPAPVLASSAA